MCHGIQVVCHGGASISLVLCYGALQCVIGFKLYIIGFKEEPCTFLQGILMGLRVQVVCRWVQIEVNTLLWGIAICHGVQVVCHWGQVEA